MLTTWTFEPTVVVPLVLAAVAWFLLVRRIDRAHPATPVPLGRSLAFYAGLATIAVALLSGVAEYDDTLFSVHMVQHLLLVFGAPPLLALAAPITQLLRASSPAVRNRWILPVLHSRVLRVIAHPIVAWLAFTAVMWLSHFSPLFEAALEDRTIHELEHVLFITSALLFWWPIIGVDPAPHRMSHPGRLIYAFLQMPQNSFLAMAILFTEDPLYQHYVSLGQPYGIDPLDDQKLAAGIMWFVGDLVFLAALLLLVGLWIRREERDTKVKERRVDLERAALRERADRLAAAKAEAEDGTAVAGSGAAPSDLESPPAPAAGAGVTDPSDDPFASPRASSPQPGIGEASSSR